MFIHSWRAFEREALRAERRRRRPTGRVGAWVTTGPSDSSSVQPGSEQSTWVRGAPCKRRHPDTASLRTWKGVRCCSAAQALDAWASDIRRRARPLRHLRPSGNDVSMLHRSAYRPRQHLPWQSWRCHSSQHCRVCHCMACCGPAGNEGPGAASGPQPARTRVTGPGLLISLPLSSADSWLAAAYCV